jgi:hypothetical protein
LVAIDDASNRLMVRFAPVEDTYHVMAFWCDYIQRHGIPAEVYTDKGAVYVDPDNPERLTQFGRAMAALGIRHIKAHSPQAKGRVERSNRTHQDRLVKALREHGISTIDHANVFLETSYTHEHNQRFAYVDGLHDLHRPASSIALDNIFCIEESRHVYNDWTITLHAHSIQLLRSEAPLPPPRAKVILRQWLDGSLHILGMSTSWPLNICRRSRTAHLHLHYLRHRITRGAGSRSEASPLSVEEKKLMLPRSRTPTLPLLQPQHKNHDGEAPFAELIPLKAGLTPPSRQLMLHHDISIGRQH